MTKKKTKKKPADDRFIPATREIAIGDGVVYRPVRMWHSGTYAGEERPRRPGQDGSGLVDADGRCYPPKSVVARLYWNVNAPGDTVSAFLSYPNGLGLVNEYFWEALGTRDDGDIERWTGPDAEDKCEAAIRAVLGDSAKASPEATAAAKAREERPARMEEARQAMRKFAETMEHESFDWGLDPFDIN